MKNSEGTKVVVPKVVIDYLMARILPCVPLDGNGITHLNEYRTHSSPNSVLSGRSAYFEHLLALPCSWEDDLTIEFNRFGEGVLLAV
jgi:hypothetical protein